MTKPNEKEHDTSGASVIVLNLVTISNDALHDDNAFHLCIFLIYRHDISEKVVDPQACMHY